MSRRCARSTRAGNFAPRMWCGRSTGASPREGRTMFGFTSCPRRRRWRRPSVRRPSSRHRRRCSACPAPSRTTSTCRACRPRTRSRPRAALPQAPDRPCSASSMPAPSSSARPTWTSWPSASSACAAPTASRATRSTRLSCRVGRAPDRVWRWGPGSSRSRSATMRQAPDACRRPSATWSASSRRPALSAIPRWSAAARPSRSRPSRCSRLTVDDGMHVLRLIAGYDPDDLFSKTEARFCDLTARVGAGALSLCRAARPRPRLLRR